jgi:glycosyltransferase involved in cell wall biosynthesis
VSRDARPKDTVDVVLLNGICVRHDAISYSLRLKLDLLRSMRDSGYPLTVRAFVQGTDYEDPDIHIRSLHDLILDPDFVSADVVIYEFGIGYELFDSLFLLRGDQRSIGVYHNVTPLELVDRPSDRTAVECGLLVRRNLGELDLVACDSDFNRQDLLDCGLSEEMLSVLELPPRVSPGGHHREPWSSDPVEVLFVGRLVRAKGIFDLLDAVSVLAAEGESGFRLTLAGSGLFSDETVVESIRAAAAGPVAIRLLSDPGDRQLDALYRNSSVFVLPSHHEGYCLPVLEAFHSGCQVVASDAGNLPSIVAGLGQITATGDAAALAAALRAAIAATRASTRRSDTTIPTVGGRLLRSAWQDAVTQHLAAHSLASYERAFLDLLGLVGVDLGRNGVLEPA